VQAGKATQQNAGKAAHAVVADAAEVEVAGVTKVVRTKRVLTLAHAARSVRKAIRSRMTSRTTACRTR
jgi:hypothetical protein